MKGLRKVIIGLAFIGIAGFLGYAGIKEHSDLIGLSTVIGALAVGVGTIMWGNSQEHKAENNLKTQP